MLLSIMGPGLAVEPNPKLAKILRKVLAAQPVGVLEAALWDERGEMNLNIWQHSDGSSLVDKPYFGNPLDQKIVETVPLADLLPGRNVDLLTMDIEGGEWRVLMNTPAEELLRFRQIVAELHGETAVAVGFEDVIGRLQNIGFEVGTTKDSVAPPKHHKVIRAIRRD